MVYRPEEVNFNTGMGNHQLRVVLRYTNNDILLFVKCADFICLEVGVLLLGFACANKVTVAMCYFI